MRVFVTGATGLIGSHTVERLRADGHWVVAMVRPGSDRAFLAGVGADAVVGDVQDSVDRLAALMQGCDAVVHAAAVLYARAPWDRYRSVNIEGTVRVLEAAAEAGVRRAIHLSSVAVYGGGTAPIREAHWRARRIPARDFYARSKREAEEAAWRLHEDGAVRLTTVRPAVVFGERDRLFTPRLARICRWRVLPLPGDGNNTLPVVYAGNVACGIVAVLERDMTVGRAYNLAQDAPLTTRRLLTGLGRALGRAPRLVPLSVFPLRVAAAASEALAGAVPWLNVPRLKRAVRLATENNPYDCERARRELDWSPCVPHEEAFARTAGWLLGEWAGC